MKQIWIYIFLANFTSIILNPSAISQPRERPFQGRITGTFVNQPTLNPTIYSGVAKANGNVTHLGTFSKVTSDSINVVSSRVDGSFVMSTPAGEQLTGIYAGNFILGPVPGTLSWSLNARITGGTGRFAGAGGNFIFRAEGKYWIDNGVINGEYTETFDGTISY